MAGDHEHHDKALASAGPSQTVPRGLAEILRPELPTVTEEIVESIRTQIAEYRRPLDGPYGRTIRAGVQHAITLFVDQIENPGIRLRASVELHRKLGQNEMREGRSLDTLQAAYRVGGRVAWRHMMSVGRRAGLSASVVSALADEVFAFLDELASVALEGYIGAKAGMGESMDRWRKRLLRSLLERPQAPAEVIAELSALTGWEIPGEVTVLALQSAPALDGAAGAGLGPDVLYDLDSRDPLIVVPGRVDENRLAEMQRPLAAVPQLAVSPPVRLDGIADGLRWARRTLVLAQEQVLPPKRVLWAQDHLATLLLCSDERLLEQLRSRALALLDDLTVKQQDRLICTLRAWLDAQGSVLDVAERLAVHPQTVRYRMRQLHELFGPSLDDPSVRFELELVLRGRARAGTGSADRDGGAETRSGRSGGSSRTAHRKPRETAPPRDGVPPRSAPAARGSSPVHGTDVPSGRPDGDGPLDESRRRNATALHEPATGWGDYRMPARMTTGPPMELPAPRSH